MNVSSSWRVKSVRAYDPRPTMSVSRLFHPVLLSGVKPEQLHADGWAIGFDARFPPNKRVQQALMFARWDRHENLYAHPLVRYLIQFY